MAGRKPGDPIAFRLSLAEEEELIQAAERHNMSVGDYARVLVRDGLHRGPLLSVMKHEVERLRRDVINSTLALLVNAGRCSPDQANKWVDEVLERKTPK